MFWSFSATWIRIKNQNFKKWEIDDDLDLFLDGSNFMRSWIIILIMLQIFEFTKYEHKGVIKSIDSDKRNFSSVKLRQNFQYFQIGIFYSWSALKGSDQYFRYFDNIWIYIKSQNLKNKKMRMISIFSRTSLILCGME